MRTGIPLTMVVMAAVVRAGSAHAQVPAPSALASQYIDEAAGLALDAAVAGALEREPALRAVRSDVAVAEAMQRQAGLRPNPTLTLEHRDEPRGTDA